MEKQDLNILLLGVSFFEGMARSTNARNLLEPLIEADHIRVSNLIYEKDAAGIDQSQSCINNINYRVIGFRKSNPFSIFSFVWRGLRFIKHNKSASKKNILYNYGEPDIKNLLFLAYARLKGYRIVLYIEEIPSYEVPDIRFITKLKIKSAVFLLKWSRYLANAVLAISYPLYDNMKEITKGKIPVYLLPISVDLRKFDIHPYQIPDNFKIFYGGSFGQKDGLEYLIKAFEIVYSKFNNVTLILTGKGHSANMNPLMDLIHKSPARDKIIFKGFLSNEAYYRLINECDIFVMSRINTKHANAGFPFKLGEFLSTGRAVISTRVGDIPKYLTNNENALVISPNSVDELEDALSFLINKPEEIIPLGAQARKTAEEFFDSQKLSQELFTIFQDV